MNVDELPAALSSEPPADVPTAAPVPDPAEVLMQVRRVILPSYILGALVLVATAIFGQVYAGVGFCIGLGFGMGNARALQRSVLLRFEALAGGGRKPKGFLSSNGARLAFITIVSIVCVYFVEPLGFGMLIGVALFQAMMISLAAATMWKQVRP